MADRPAELEAESPDAIDVLALPVGHVRSAGCWCMPIPTSIAGVPARIHRLKPPPMAPGLAPPRPDDPGRA